MAENIDDLTITYEEDGVETTKELGKIILSRGAWTTILYRYQDWDRAKSVYGPVKFSLRRYQKRGGQFQQKSKFNISSVDQAQQIIDGLQTWLKDDEQH